jgi:hypothetical protein
LLQRSQKEVKCTVRKKKKVVIAKEFMFPESCKSTLNEVKKGGKTFVLMMSLMMRKVAYK